MSPDDVELLTRFFGRLHVQDLDPNLWSAVRSALPDSLKISLNGDYIESRHPSSFESIPNQALTFIASVEQLPTRKEYAGAIVKYDEWWRYCASKLTIARILYATERYSDVNALFVSNIGQDESLRANRALWYDAISRIGHYNFWALLTTETNRSELISYLRYSWQQGDFDRCLGICSMLDGVQLEPPEHARYLNNKIRVLRDVGEIERSRQAIDAYYLEIGRLRDQGADPHLLSSRTATYEYNVAIDEFIKGRLTRCIALCDASLGRRQDQYPVPYIVLRKVRAAILMGRPAFALDLINAPELNTNDKWAASLLESVRAEHSLFSLRDAVAAETQWKKSRELEEAIGSVFCYANLGLTLCAIARGDSRQLSHLNDVLGRQRPVDAHIYQQFGALTLSLLEGRPTDLHAGVSAICNKFTEYQSSLFSALFAFALLVKDTGHRDMWPKGATSRFLGLDFDLSFFGDLEMTKVPAVFISYSHDSDEHKEWCFRLHNKLRENGVRSTIDAALKGTTTIDFNSMMVKGVRDSDMILVVLTPAYKAKIESEQGGAYAEFGLLRDEILRRDYTRIIFILRSGDFASTIPFEAKGVEQHDFRNEMLADGPPTDTFKTLLHRVYTVPLFKQTPVGPPPTLSPRKV